MLSRNQRIYLDVNKPTNFQIVGESALTYNKLMWGGGDLVLYTPVSLLDNLSYGDIHLEHNHFTDGYYCNEVDGENNLWLPSAERALVDTINFIEQNYIEGPLIESLQTYLSEHDDLSKLYEVADFYKVSRDTIDYWINEAREESSMSMG